MTAPTFDAQREAWARVPVDDEGYFSVADLLALPDGDLAALVARMATVRYGGWRNYGGLWRSILGLDDTSGCEVLDYGCGVGIDSRELALAGNSVILADVRPDTLELAARVHTLAGRSPRATRRIARTQRVPGKAASVDIVICSGVLHHIPDPRPAVAEMHRLLRPGGLLRLMTYSDEGWRGYIGTEPPADVASDPDRHRFVRTFDEVGEWADWYDAYRLERRFGDLFELERFEYLAPDRRYCGAVMRRRQT